MVGCIDDSCSPHSSSDGRACTPADQLSEMHRPAAAAAIGGQRARRGEVRHLHHQLPNSGAHRCGLQLAAAAHSAGLWRAARSPCKALCLGGNGPNASMERSRRRPSLAPCRSATSGPGTRSRRACVKASPHAAAARPAAARVPFILRPGCEPQLFLPPAPAQCCTRPTMRRWWRTWVRSDMTASCCCGTTASAGAQAPRRSAGPCHPQPRMHCADQGTALAVLGLCLRSPQSRS